MSKTGGYYEIGSGSSIQRSRTKYVDQRVKLSLPCGTVISHHKKLKPKTNSSRSNCTNNRTLKFIFSRFHVLELSGNFAYPSDGFYGSVMITTCLDFLSLFICRLMTMNCLIRLYSITSHRPRL